MALHLVRHADAVSGHPDELRTLSERGQRQAVALAEHLREFPFRRILVSRYARCQETVSPLAEALALPIEPVDALAEEADPAATWALLQELGSTEAVLCSHGNIIGSILDRLRHQRVAIDASELTCRKGSVWRIEVDDHGFSRAVLAVSEA